MSDEDLPPTHRPWGADPGQQPSSDVPPPPPPNWQPAGGAPYAPPPNPYPQPGSFDQYAAPTPYAASPYGVHPGVAGALPPEHPSVTTGMVLGIVGLVGIVTCAGLTLVLSPFAWVISGRALREIDASPGRYSGREKANAGRITGIIGTVLLALGVLALVAIITLIAWVGSSSSNSRPNDPQVHHSGAVNS